MGWSCPATIGGPSERLVEDGIRDRDRLLAAENAGRGFWQVRRGSVVGFKGFSPHGRKRAPNGTRYRNKGFVVGREVAMVSHVEADGHEDEAPLWTEGRQQG